MVYNSESEAQGGKLRKPRHDVRCPSGWQSTEERGECWTYLANPPRSRLSNNRPCAAGELNEWDIWCTSNYQHVTYSEAERAGVYDVNIYYLITEARLQDSAYSYFSLAATPFFEAKKNGGALAAPLAASQAPASQTAQTIPTAPAAQTNPNCPAPSQASAAGQALGGLLGGRRGNSQAGAALGGLLGQVAAGAARPAGC